MRNNVFVQDALGDGDELLLVDGLGEGSTGGALDELKPEVSEMDGTLTDVTGVEEWLGVGERDTSLLTPAPGLISCFVAIGSFGLPAR